MRVVGHFKLRSYGDVYSAAEKLVDNGFKPEGAHLHKDGGVFLRKPPYYPDEINIRRMTVQQPDFEGVGIGTVYGAGLCDELLIVLPA